MVGWCLDYSYTTSVWWVLLFVLFPISASLVQAIHRQAAQDPKGTVASKEGVQKGQEHAALQGVQTCGMEESGPMTCPIMFNKKHTRYMLQSECILEHDCLEHIPLKVAMRTRPRPKSSQPV